MADEYISREAFKAEALRLSTHYLNEWDTLGVLAAADRIPSADVAPVRHGRWLAHRLDNSYTTWTCSVCGTIGVEAFHYCPNCGCHMDLEVANER